METELKAQVVQAAEAVKKKVQELRMMESHNEKILDTVFQPITKPLHQLIRNNNHLKTLNESTEDTKDNKIYIKNYKNQSHDSKNTNYENIPCTSQNDISDDNIDMESPDTSFRTIESVASPSNDDSSWSLSTDVFDNVPYGVRRERGKLMIGKSRVYVHDNKLSIADHDYTTTPGLNELLFKKVPILDLITETDYQTYKAILTETNAHRRDYDPNKPIKSNRGQKYLRIIKPLFNLRIPSTSASSTTRGYLSEGEGLTLKKRLKENTDYIYWDDPNELVERLKLLIASKDAGNNGLDNEIISIIEELRENNIIN